MSFRHRRAFLISVFSVRLHPRVSSLMRISPFLVFAPYLVHFCSLPCICSIPHFFSLALFFISLLQFRRPYVNSSARIFSCDHLFLARDSLVSLLARPQAPFITHVPSTQSSSYQCFSSFMEGLFKTPLFAQCELRIDINSGIVFSSV